MEFDKEKKISVARKFPSPPHNFSNGPSLMEGLERKELYLSIYLSIL